MPVDVAKIKELFLAALETPVNERAAFLATACGDDTVLRDQIEAMLRTHENSGELLPRSPSQMLADSGTTEADGTIAFAQEPRPSLTIAESGKSASDGLEFLLPSEKPGHLGRLGHYEIQAIIGKGGFGIVLKGFDEKLHRVVAIKVLSPAYAANGAARNRFIREARAVAAVKNEHVVGIYGVDEDSQPPYFVMELIDGISLQDKLDKHGPLGVKETLRIGMQIAEGLAAAHKQGKIHRDIKPANILLENGVERVKITDFGLARAVDDASVTQSGTVAGTPMYMSPEQAEGLAIDHRSDLFSLGTVLYAMCTGHPPFRASGTHAVLKRVIDASPRPIREINNEIPDWLCDIIAKLHAKKPEDRFQTAKEVAELLGQHLAHLQQPQTVALPARVFPPADGLSTPSLEKETSHHPGIRRSVMRFLAVAPWVALLTGVTMLVLAPPLGPERFDGIRFLAVLFGILGILGLIAYRAVRQVEKKPAGSADTGAPRVKRGLGGALRWLGSGVAIAAVVILVFWVIPMWWRGSGTIEFQSNDPQVQVFVSAQDGSSTWRLTGNGEVELPAGFYYVEARCASEHLIDLISITDWEFKKRTFPDGVDKEKMSIRVEKGQRTYIDVRVKPREARTEPDWVQLFNGTDLKGWIAPAPGTGKGDWHVEKGYGQLVGDGAVASCVMTERDDYADFHLKTEVSCTAGTQSGIFFRCGKDFGPNAVLPGYQVVTGFGQQEFNTGALLLTTPGDLKTLKLFNPTTGANFASFYPLEIIARGNRFTVMVKGKIVTDYTSDTSVYRKGRIALRVYSPPGGGSGGAVVFKKIEIKELPPEEPGWVQLFNGKDLTGWNADPKNKGTWNIEDGVLVGRSNNDLCRLVSDRGDRRDFHLRVTAKVSAKGLAEGAVWFRTPRETKNLTEGYEAILNVSSVAGMLPGTIRFVRGTNISTPHQVKVQQTPIPPDAWFDLEIIAQGDKITALVNGKKEAQISRAFREHGFLALHVYRGVVHFKKIEIMELPPEEPGWVQLWSGKDLTCWRIHEKDDPKSWQVVTGKDQNQLVGHSGVLYSERDYENFHLRAEVMYSAEGGAEICFRASRNAANGRYGGGYKAGYTVPLTPRDTGSIRFMNAKNVERDIRSLITFRAGEFFTLEIIAKGNHLVTKINGNVAADWKDEESQPTRGRIALQVFGPGNSLNCRKIEIKELPPFEERGWVPLFNGKDLTGWTGDTANWVATADGVVTKGQTTAFLRTDRIYRNFELTAEFRCPEPFASQENTGLLLAVQEPGDDFSSGYMISLSNPTRAAITARGSAQGKWVGTKPSSWVEKPAGQWNELRMHSQDGAIKFWANGEFIGTLSECDLRKGHIALHARRNEIQFRNVKIKEQPPEEPAWAPLFDGKGLDEWVEFEILDETGLMQRAARKLFTVGDGILYGHSGKSMLLTKRDNFRDFHLRMEVKSDESTKAALDIRSTGTQTSGYAIDLGNYMKPPGEPGRKYGPGSIQYWQRGPKTNAHVAAAANLVQPEQWYVLEVIAQGKRIHVKINGKTAVELTDDPAQAKGGHIAIQLNPADNKGLHIRKVEIKELPPEAPGWVQLFNGKDTAAWDMKASPLWKFENGVLSCKGGDLVPVRKLFKDCRIKVEARYFGGECYLRLGPQGIQEPKGNLRFAHHLIHLHNETSGAKTGSISAHIGDLRKIERNNLANYTRPGEWFTLEVDYQGRRMQTWVNGKPAAEFTNQEPGTYILGAGMAIGVVGDGGELEIRKVEVRDLPPEEIGWVQLFNGADLTHWIELGRSRWFANERILSCTAKAGESSKLAATNIELSTRAQFANFHLVAEARLLGQGKGGILFRGDADGHYHLAISAKNTGSIARAGKEFKWFENKEHALVEPEKWFKLELIAVGSKLTSKVNGQIVDNVEDASFTRGLLELFLEADKNAPATIEFRKIEIKELPSAATLPDAAEQVLPALAGAWKGEYTQKIYGGKPDVKKFAAVAANDWIVGQKWLRQRVQIGDEGFQSVTTYEPGAKLFRDWFFHSRGLIFGPSTGRWDAATRTMTWTNLPKDGVVLLMTLRFIDADTITGDILIRDKEGETQFQMSSLMMRTSGNITVDENIAAGPLPKEMAVLDRLLGDWQINAVIKDAAHPAGLKAAWQIAARKILGGRVIAERATGHPLDKESYTLTTFDTFSKAYGRWLFKVDGSVMEHGGLWDEKSQLMKWHWAGRDGSESSNTGNLSAADRRDWHIVTKDALGKVTRDVQATAIRRSEPGWVRLFNGKDLAGWHISDQHPGSWTVADGILTGKLTDDKWLRTVLVSDRKDLVNFHARIEMKLNRGSTRVAVHAQPASFTTNEMFLRFDEKAPKQSMGVTVHRRDDPKALERFDVDTAKLRGQWFTLEIIANESEITYLIDGKEVARVKDVRFQPGHLSLDVGVGDLNAILSVRKIEIKELPSK